jgi:hypothetical protein
MESGHCICLGELVALLDQSLDWQYLVFLIRQEVHFIGGSGSVQVLDQR